jgi:hypothetical protein
MQITITLNFENETLQKYAEWKGNVTSEVPAMDSMEYIRLYWKNEVMRDVNSFLDSQAENMVREQIAQATEALKADAANKITIE